MKRALAVFACMSLSGSLVAQHANNCVTNASGKVVCTGGQSAAAVNPRTGNAAVAQKNSNGVTTTQTTRGGSSTTKNGKGVATGPGGVTCAKGKYTQGCTPPK